MREGARARAHTGTRTSRSLGRSEIDRTLQPRGRLPLLLDSAEPARRSCCLQSPRGCLCPRAPRSSLGNEDCLPRTAGEAEPACARDCEPRGG